MVRSSSIQLRVWQPVICICIAVNVFSAPSLADDLFKLRAQEQGYQQQQNYPAPQSIPNQYNDRYNLNSSSPPPLQGGVRTQIVLPPPFLGSWNVQGHRVKIEALPAYQQSSQQAFSESTRNIWDISGSPQDGYTMGSNTGIKTALVIDKVEGSQAYIRYAHPVGSTMAQEAVVLELGPGGHSFVGLERISIVKDPQQPARAKVTYQLSGSRRP